jgi:endo-1,4-beta-xylanase
MGGTLTLGTSAGPARRFVLLAVLAVALIVAGVVGLTPLLMPGAPPPSKQASGAPAPVRVVTSDFEDGTTQNWQPRAGGTVDNATAVSHGGRRALAIGGRTASSQGPSLDLTGKVREHTQYTLSVWVRLATGAQATPMRMSVEWGASGTAGRDVVVASATVTSGAWAHLQGAHRPVSGVDAISVYVESASGTPSFFIDDFTLSYLPGPTDVPALKRVFADSFAIGAAVGERQLTGDHADLLKKHFNSVTPTSSMKWTTTEPDEGTFTFGDADAIVNFATANRIKVRGHTLVWHRQVPPWVFQDAAGKPMTPTAENKALLLSRMESHIKTIVGRYRGQIYAWDVVNEVIANDGSMRDSPWFQIAGLDYIRRAFITAHAADPDAVLCVNDFDLTRPERRDAMYNLVSQLRSDGVPVNCIGSQMHSNIEAPSASDAAATIDKFANLGVDQHITELDISIYTDDSSSYSTIPAGLLARQAAAYKSLFEVFRSRRGKISSVTLWGLADDDTWLDSFPIERTDAPLLFDDALRPKPAFWATVGTATQSEAGPGR